MPAPSTRQRLAAFFVLGLVLGLTGGALQLIESHCRAFERGALAEFRVVAFLNRGAGQAAWKVEEERLRALPEVEEARFVSPDESLASLKREDPELFDAVALVGENPLPPAVELRLSPEGVTRVPQTAAEVHSSEAVSEVRYPVSTASAILHSRFYGHYIGLALNAALTAAALSILGGVWFGRAAAWSETLWTWLGSAAGLGAALLFALPMRRHALWWDTPEVWRMFLWACACAGAAWALVASRPRGHRLEPRDQERPVAVLDAGRAERDG
ncbi:MAG: hypothetical protein HY924_04945 [Elusimicrobia bacterium]|nr:hypothetical protein [Elusimicrobiota bacterium]